MTSVNNRYIRTVGGQYSAWCNNGGKAKPWGACERQWIDRHFTDCAASGYYTFSPSISGNAIIGGGTIYGGNLNGSVSICPSTPSCQVIVTENMNFTIRAGGGGYSWCGPWCGWCHCENYTTGSCRVNGKQTPTLSSGTYTSGTLCGSGTCMIP